MDPVTLVVTALVAGVSAGVSASASLAVTDAYGSLRDAVRRRVAASGSDVSVLDETDSEPQEWGSRLTRVLAATDVGGDAESVAAARRLLALVDSAGGGGYDLRQAKGVQVGDHNVQVNRFDG